jgi:hypothetical protein
MMYLRCQALRWVDDEPQPGIVEVAFPDAEGEPQVMIDKCAIFDADNILHPQASYPVSLELPVEIVDRRATDAHGDLIAVALPWGLGDALVAHPVWVRGDQVVEH